MKGLEAFKPLKSRIVTLSKKFNFLRTVEDNTLKIVFSICNVFNVGCKLYTWGGGGGGAHV